MDVIVFMGPTMSIRDASAHLEARYLPPAAQGDIYRVTEECLPFAIGVVDGYFERVPAIWHKEILWALKRGVHVFGAASMGALRAAELTAFGMKGVGEIYQAFHSGALEDDDEVAVAHGDAEAGFRPTSEAMVNIRATLSAAERSSVLGPVARAEIERIAKGLFYPDRSYPRLFALALARGVPPREIDALKHFVASDRVDQKRADAIALLAALEGCCRAGGDPQPSKFSFSHTDAWDHMVNWAASREPLCESGEAPRPSLVAAEARLSARRLRGVFATALNRAVAGTLARNRGIADRDDRMNQLDLRVRDNQGKSGEGTVSDGLPGEYELSAREYRMFLERTVELDWLRDRYRDRMDRHLVDELRCRGEYASLSRRARDKDRVLASHGLAEPTLRDAVISSQELLAWYFKDRIGEPIPADLEGFLRELGVIDASALEQEALRELLYCRLVGEAAVQRP